MQRVKARTPKRPRVSRKQRLITSLIIIAIAIGWFIYTTSQSDQALNKSLNQLDNTGNQVQQNDTQLNNSAKQLDSAAQQVQTSSPQ
jgi:predicted negative regulator of RcsB-dependent stress response